MDVVALDVAEIVGPPYAVISLHPALGPLSGQRTLSIRGINFKLDTKIEVELMTTHTYACIYI